MANKVYDLGKFKAENPGIVEQENKLTQHNSKMTHHQMANAVVKSYKIRPVYCNGNFFEYLGGLWVKREESYLTVLVAKTFDGQPRCSTRAQYKQIASQILDLTDDPEFFLNVPVGIAVNGEYWKLEKSGQIFKEPLLDYHKQTHQFLFKNSRACPKWFEFLKSQIPGQ